MSSDIAITVHANRVRAAAKDCPDVDRVLRTLFPEAFEEEKKTLTWEDLKLGDIYRMEGLSNRHMFIGDSTAVYTALRQHSPYEHDVYYSLPLDHASTPPGILWSASKDSRSVEILGPPLEGPEQAGPSGRM